MATARILDEDVVLSGYHVPAEVSLDTKKFSFKSSSYHWNTKAHYNRRLPNFCLEIPETFGPCQMESPVSKNLVFSFNLQSHW